MSIPGFKAPRRHNRQFPGKLGKRPDKAVERKEGALARHLDAIASWHTTGGIVAEEKIAKLEKHVAGTKKKLGLEA